jgi:hypothetical protein
LSDALKKLEVHAPITSGWFAACDSALRLSKTAVLSCRDDPRSPEARIYPMGQEKFSTIISQTSWPLPCSIALAV